MDKQVRFELGHPLSRLARRPSLAGTGLPERMRSTTFALLGLTAAAGLGMVAIFSQQGWPLLAPSPLPAVGTGPVAIDDAAIVGHSAPRAGGGRRESASVAGAGGATSAPPAPGIGSSGVNRQAQVHGAKPSAPDAPQPTGPSEPASPAPPPVSAPAPTPVQVPPPAPAASPPAPPASPPSSAAADDVPGKGHAYGHFKSVGKGHHLVPAPPPTTEDLADPVPAPIEPEPVEESDENDQHGNGHAYGHFR
jgi:hypothetical protein